MTNSVDPDQTAPLIWVSTVLSDLSLLMLYFTVYNILKHNAKYSERGI